ncbi:FKBP12-interacting protein of 37 kDa-like [Actinidia eriantha]|uniref:FKBP12-interacting protein of 37 kDa-like n=1 Tax=Actinidia eriantha TaxID=165200 RepID=UPI00258AFD63|nr:FKBP12-interacting protein of 37 kDa-like [Actinidia eriantha]
MNPHPRVCVAVGCVAASGNDVEHAWRLSQMTVGDDVAHAWTKGCDGSKAWGFFCVPCSNSEFTLIIYKSAVRDLRTQLKPPSMQARRLLLDPAIHEEFTRLKNLVEEKDKKIKELQDNVAAVNFTQHSKMGKMLMAKCRTLQEENDEIGNQVTHFTYIHELGMKLALQKSQNAELRSQFEELCKVMEGLTDDVEKSNEMVLILQDRLEEKDAEITRLKHELQKRNATAEEEEKTEVSSDKKDGDEEMIGGEAEIEI